MKTHTPGPWHITRNTVPGQFCTYTKVRDREDGVIAVMHMNEGANARLIASAPDLLLALQRLAHPMADDEDLDYAREVIAKAKGNE